MADAPAAEGAAGVGGAADTVMPAPDTGSTPPMTAGHAAGAAADPWQALRRFTPARIALGRAGQSLPTRALLEFGPAQALARDAVVEPSHGPALLGQLAAEGFATLAVRSAAGDRAGYLRRPDLGRRLDEDSRGRLREWAANAAAAAGAAPGSGLAPDLVLVIADGLSAQATGRHALPLLRALCAGLSGWRLGPVVVAEFARVALGDEIGALMGARQVAVLIGERPGLSAPDSMGIYLTHAPRPGRTDAERNCISNVRPAGLPVEMAARRLRFLLEGAVRLGRTGIDLKDESETAAPGSTPLLDAPPA